MQDKGRIDELFGKGKKQSQSTEITLIKQKVGFGFDFQLPYFQPEPANYDELPSVGQKRQP